MDESPYSTLVGPNAGENLTECAESVIIGASAGRHATNNPRAIFIGLQAGGGLATDVGGTGDVDNNDHCIGIGYASLRYCFDSAKIVGIGYAAMENANTSPGAVGVGLFAGIFARQSIDSVWLGHGSGMAGEDSARAIGIGFFAGASQVVDTEYGTPLNCPDGVFIGTEAGNPRIKSDAPNAGPLARGAVRPVVIGAQATCGPGISKPVAIGNEARALHDNSVALGADTASTAANQVMIGARDLEVTDPARGVILHSPNNSRYRISVSNAGALSAIAA
jgi:hypothetical protein